MACPNLNWDWHSSAPACFPYFESQLKFSSWHSIDDLANRCRNLSDTCQMEERLTEIVNILAVSINKILGGHFFLTGVGFFICCWCLTCVCHREYFSDTCQIKRNSKDSNGGDKRPIKGCSKSDHILFSLYLGPRCSDLQNSCVYPP